MKRVAAAVASLCVLTAACGGPHGFISRSAPPTDSPTTVGFVGATYGLPWSASLAAGLSAGAKRFGGSVDVEAPTSPNPYDQVLYAQEQVGRHPSAVGVVATDPTALCPTARVAQRSGVLFYAAGSNVACPGVGLFVEPADPAAIGADTISVLAGEVHGSGDVAIVSAGATEPDLQSWIRAMSASLAAYPNLHLVPVQTGAVTGPENTVVADRLMAAYPDLKAIIGAGPANVGPVARAVDQAGKKGKVVVTGVADPNSLRPWFANGTVHAVVYYNSVHLGYLTYWAVDQMLHHRGFLPSQDVPGLPGPVTWDAPSHTLVLGPPVIITRADAGRFNF